MKATGMTRPLDELGRITLPVELRRTMGLKEKDLLGIYTQGSAIVLAPVTKVCFKCGRPHENLIFDGDKDEPGSIGICPDCLDAFNDWRE